MRYRSDPTLPRPTTNNSRRDEIKVIQMTNEGFQWIVFQGFLRMHGYLIRSLFLFFSVYNVSF